MASFIRQLNMYGFRKVMNYEKSGLRNENDEMEFQHPFFMKEQSALLELIKRKIPNTKVTIAEPAVKSNARDILTDLSSIREKQENMDNMLLKMKQENELLWRELTSMRQKHKAQEQIIQKVIQFLVSIVQQNNQNNIGVGMQRKMARMLQDSTGNKGNSQVTCTIDVLRKNKNSNFITVPQDKLVSPLGPVIHEVTDLDHEQEDSPISPCVKSPEDKSENGANCAESDIQEIECPMDSSLNSPINTSGTMEPLSILEPLHLNTSVLNSDDVNLEESILGMPLDCCVISQDNVISIPEELPSNITSLPDPSYPNTDYNPNTVIYTSTNSDYDDSMSESLHTPKVPTIHIEDVYALPKQQDKQDNNNSTNNKVNTALNEHNYQLAVSEPSSVVKSSTFNKNTLSNHLLKVEELLSGLQGQLASSSWSLLDSDELLELFHTDGVVNNEALAGGIADVTNIKTEPSDIIGNELVQFTPSMLEVDLDNNQLLECLSQDSTVSSQTTNDQKNFLLVDVLNNTDQEAASEAAEYLLNNGSAPKHKSPRRPKIQKAKRRKLK